MLIVIFIIVSGLALYSLIYNVWFFHNYRKSHPVFSILSPLSALTTGILFNLTFLQ